jgi:hypothetical protein
MRINFVPAMLGAALACGGKPASSPESQSGRFALVLPERITVRVNETGIITLLAIGASGRVSYDVRGLPPFASAEGSTIRVTPGPGAAGETTVTVTATDGAHSDSGSFILSVTELAPVDPGHTNRPPGFADIMDLKGTLDISSSTSAFMIGGSTLLRLRGDAYLQCGFRDADADAVQMLAEVRPVTEALTGTANYQSELAANPGNNHSFIAPDGVITLHLPTVEVGTHYQIAVWMRDVHGAESVHAIQKDFLRLE